MSRKGERSFAEASKQIQENLNRHIAKYGAQLDEKSDDDESEGENGRTDELLEQMLGHFSKNSDDSLVDSTKEFLKTAIRAVSCLICIESIKKTDAVWNCSTCYVTLHLNCTQKWAKDSIFFQKQQEEEEAASGRCKASQLSWSCPNCRSSYSPNKVPDRYLCFCGKETEPRFDPWITAHSCGEKCLKPLQSGCGHKCLLLCHPGPCPPCPQVVQVTCYCGKSTPTTKRCSASTWSCNTECGRRLACGTHTCNNFCHPGPCHTCPKTSTQACLCQKAKEPRPCASPPWRCGTKCGKLLKCGYHSCDNICHIKGECPPCPLSLTRHCPCGKSDYSLPCTEATPTCGDTCGKLLGCGSHYCAERCHRGNCPSCLQMTTKFCRCGSKKKEVQCAKQFTCDVKCKKIRDCRKHPCNKKCCIGDCPPCEQMCGKTLNCKNHKCLSRCHQGPCFPCTQKSQVVCNCGETKLEVPCGKEKSVKPPKCKKVCTTKSDCHHAERVRHFCHRGPCPECKQVCGGQLACLHICPAPCHDNVLVRLDTNTRPVGPWENRGPVYETRRLACPPCRHPVPTACLGQHETVDMACHEAKPMSCGRKCGRLLSCTNHTCERECHRVRHAADLFTAGINCKKCESKCERPRPAGCQHTCNEGCHQGECKPCQVNLKLKCHCGINNLFIKCSEFCSTNEVEREQRLSCQDQCPKLMACGHRCTNLCHAGNCTPPNQCKKKVKLTCMCKRKKEEYRCFNVNAVPNPVVCDQDCEAAKQEKLEARNKSRSDTRQEEDAHTRREAEIFEKQLEGGKRKRRNRRRETETEEESFYSKYKVIIVGCLLFSSVILGFVVFNHA